MISRLDDLRFHL